MLAVRNITAAKKITNKTKKKKPKTTKLTKRSQSQVWRHIPIILVFERLVQKDWV